MDAGQQSAKGIIEGDHIKLLEPVQIADGTFVELTITISNGDKENNTQLRGTREDWERSTSAAQPAEATGNAASQARERQEDALREGIHLGGPPYPSREELHER